MINFNLQVFFLKNSGTGIGTFSRKNVPVKISD